MSIIGRIEHEAKFELSPAQDPAIFAEALAQAGYSVRPLGIIDVTDTYMDTPAYTLLRHGLALRVRCGIAASEVGIKAIEGQRNGVSQARLDLAFALTADTDPLDATTWPAAVFDELAATVKVKPKSLQPLFVVRQQRAKSHLHPATPENLPTNGHDAQAASDPSWVAEWSQDEVWIEDADAGKRSHFRELEVELLPARKLIDQQHGDLSSTQVEAERKGFDEFVAHVQQEFDLNPIYLSKFVRGLTQSVAWQHCGAQQITADMPLAAAYRLLLHQQLLQVLLSEHGVRAGEQARYVHDTRVAIRRARAILRLCDGVLPKKAITAHAKQLKRFGRVLGAVRDLDVALANLRTFARDQPPDAQRGFKRLRAELKTQRKHAHAVLLDHLDSKEHRKFIARFAQFCAAPTQDDARHDDHVEITPRQVRHTMPSLTWAAFEAVRAYETVLSPDATPPVATLHALRIQTKYLRYLIEFTQHMLGRDGDLLARQLRELQEHLGELNDAHVEDLRLLGWDAQVKNGDGLHAAIASRRAELAARMAQLSTTVPFAQLVALRGRRRLARALAAI